MTDFEFIIPNIADTIHIKLYGTEYNVPIKELSISELQQYADLIKEELIKKWYSNKKNYNTHKLISSNLS